jgi:hypothetical protein
MKTKTIGLTLAVSFLTGTACFAVNPQMGTWKLNQARSNLAAGMGKSTMVIYTQKGDNVQVTVDGVDKDGKPTHGVWVGKWDGKAYKAKGNLPWDSAAYRVVNDYSNNITTMKNGKVAWTGTITVSKDGKSRTVTIQGSDTNGKKFTSKAVYDKA